MYGQNAKAHKLQLYIDIQCELFNQLVLPIPIDEIKVHQLYEIWLAQFSLKQCAQKRHKTPSFHFCMKYGESGHINIFYTISQRLAKACKWKIK